MGRFYLSKMMQFKKYFFVAVVLLFTTRLLSQEHYVLHVQGKISLEDGEKTLNPKDRFTITNKTRIVFGSIKDRMITMREDGSRYIFKPREAAARKSGSELSFFARTTLLPVRKRTSSRGVYNGLTSYLEENNVVCLDGELLFPGLKTQLNLLLKIDNDFLPVELDQGDGFYKIPLKRTAPEFAEIYVKNGDKREYVAEILILNVEKEQIQDDLKAIAKGLDAVEMANDEKEELLRDYFLEYYGLIPERLLKSLIQKAR